MAIDESIANTAITTTSSIRENPLLALYRKAFFLLKKIYFS